MKPKFWITVMVVPNNFERVERYSLHESWSTALCNLLEQEAFILK